MLAVHGFAALDLATHVHGFVFDTKALEEEGEEEAEEEEADEDEDEEDN
jgi:hypothetical protein